MNHNIIYAEKGDPWQFPLIYKVTSYTVRFMDLHHFGKEGPLCGKLFINGLQIAAPHYEGFGGPIIIKGKYIYLSLYQMISNARSNCARVFIVEIDVLRKSYRIIGKRVEYAVVFLDHIENDTLFYYNFSRKNNKWLRNVNINSVNMPWRWSEKFTHLCHELSFFFHDLFQ